MPETQVSQADMAQALLEQFFADEVVAEAVSKENVVQWLEREFPDTTIQQRNFVLGYGKRTKMWHDDKDGFWVRGPAASDGKVETHKLTPPMEISQIEALADPKDQFYALAIGLGIPDRAAKSAAFYCSNNFNMDHPDRLLEAIDQCSDISPMQRRRLVKTWLSFRGIRPTQAFTEKVEQQYPSIEETKAKGAGSSRRYVAIGGDVLLVDDGDPAGQSFAEAVRFANLQIEKTRALMPGAPAAPAEPASTAAMIKVLGDLATGALTPRADPAAATSTTEVFKLMIDGVRDSSANTMALIKQDLDHRLENEARDRKAAEERSNAILAKLTDAISALAQPRNPFDSLDQVLPGIGQRLLDNLLNPPRQEGAFRVTIGDQEGNMTMDEYERFSKVENQKEFTKMLRVQLPEFFAMGRDFAQAAKRAPEGDVKDLPGSRQLGSQPDPGFNGYCVACLRMLMLEENVEQFRCPHCDALQNMAGELLDAASVEQEELRTEESPTPEEQADAAFDANPLVLRPLDQLDKDREWSPEPAPEELPPPSRSEAATPTVKAAASA